MEPITTGMLVGAGSGLLSNLFNFGANKNTNKTNLKIAQMNNEWSEKMMQKQMDYNTDMWNKTNAYNDPTNQRARLERAGLNTSLMMNGGSAGIASAASGPSLPSPSQAVMQPNRYDFSSIGEAVTNSYLAEGQRKQMDSQSRVNNATADWYGAKAMSDIAQAFANVRNKDLQSKGQAIQNKWADSMLGAQYINQIRQNQSMEISMMNAIKQGVLMDKQIAKYDERTNAEIADLVASTSLKYAQGQMSKQELENAIETNKALKLSNKEKEAIFDYVVETAEKESNSVYWNTAGNFISNIAGAISGLWKPKPLKVKGVTTYKSGSKTDKYYHYE